MDLARRFGLQAHADEGEEQQHKDKDISALPSAATAVASTAGSITTSSHPHNDRHHDDDDDDVSNGGGGISGGGAPSGVLVPIPVDSRASAVSAMMSADSSLQDLAAAVEDHLHPSDVAARETTAAAAIAAAVAGATEHHEHYFQDPLHPTVPETVSTLEHILASATAAPVHEQEQLQGAVTAHEQHHEAEHYFQDPLHPTVPETVATLEHILASAALAPVHEQEQEEQVQGAVTVHEQHEVAAAAAAAEQQHEVDPLHYFQDPLHPTVPETVASLEHILTAVRPPSEEQEACTLATSFDAPRATSASGVHEQPGGGRTLTGVDDVTARQGRSGNSGCSSSVASFEAKSAPLTAAPATAVAAAAIAAESSASAVSEGERSSLFEIPHSDASDGEEPSEVFVDCASDFGDTDAGDDERAVSDCEPETSVPSGAVMWDSGSNNSSSSSSNSGSNSNGSSGGWCDGEQAFATAAAAAVAAIETAFASTEGGEVAGNSPLELVQEVEVVGGGGMRASGSQEWLDPMAFDGAA